MFNLFSKPPVQLSKRLFSLDNDRVRVESITKPGVNGWRVYVQREGRFDRVDENRFGADDFDDAIKFAKKL